MFYESIDPNRTKGLEYEIQKNKGDITFIKKWGFSHKFFKKYYLRSRSVYDGPLQSPNKNLFYFFELFINKLKLVYLKIFY